MPVQEAIERLEYILSVVPGKLTAISDEELYNKPAPNKWSKLEILGHLVDSAANNWQRFVRIQFEDMPHIVYDQNNWNNHSYYNKAEGDNVIQLWATVNGHLLFIAKNIPQDKLQLKSRSNEPEPVALGFLIEDYVMHMEHHLRQILPGGY